MEWHFGHNCKHFVPTLGKCRVFITRYKQRADLMADKWLKTRDFLVYTGSSPDELVAQVERGEVEAKRIKAPRNPEQDGFWRIRQRCSWDWDNCALSDTGGYCVFFDLHGGERIACIADLRHLETEHPNMVKVPPADEWMRVEERLTALQAEGRSVPSST